jgi:predicted HTH domain antitoxin
MGSRKIQVELPEELARLVDLSGSNVSRKVLELALLRLVQDGEISSGKAAAVLGIPRTEFWHLMYEHRIPLFDLSEEELREDLNNAAKFQLRDSK